MVTFTVEFLSRDDQGRFKRFRRRIPADDHEEALSWALHGERHGKWQIEGPIMTRNERKDEKSTYEM